MEWTVSLKSAITYMEEHLLEDISASEVAAAVHMSPFYLQKGFGIMTGYSIGEYIRCRRLYLAALDIRAGYDKIIDLAYKYGYDTPESFTKAFRRFHGVSPARLKRDPTEINTFLPLKITVQIQGGNEMDVTVEKMEGFQVIGFTRIFSFKDSYEKIPLFWDEFCRKYLRPLQEKGEPENEVEQVIRDCMVGEYALCVHDDTLDDGSFRYMIAGKYNGGAIPEGMEVTALPEAEWAKFCCTGPMPGALQAVNTKIFEEWLPGNPKYEIAMESNIEWYSEGNMSAPDYKSAIWIPVKEKVKEA